MKSDTAQTVLFDAVTADSVPTTAEERPGFRFVKRIGWIPEDWDVCSVLDLASDERNATVGGPFGSNLTSKDYSESGVPVIRGANMSDSWIGGEFVFVSDVKAKKLSANTAVPFDLVLTQRGTLGQASMVPEGKYPLYVISQSQMKVTLDLDICDPLYVLYVFKSDVAERQLWTDTIQTGVPHINLGILREWLIPTPPLPEQREIARVLGTWDRALADLDALLDAKRERAHGLAQRLMTGDVRLPGFQNCVPMRSLGDFFRHVSTRNKQRRDLTPLSCSKVYGIVPQSQIFDKRIASDDTSNYKVVQRGDLVYDPMLLWDASIGFVDSIDEGVISPAYATFHLNEQTGDRSFFRHFFDGHYMRHQYKVISQGTNTRRRKAMASDFLAVDARVPPLDEQRQIAAILDAAGAEIAALRDQRDALARQKKGLMQRLLTGEVRVPASSLGR